MVLSRFKRRIVLNGIFFKLYLAFLAFFVLPVIIASLIFNQYTVSIVEREVNNSNLSLLKHTADVVDTKFKEIRRTMLEISRKPEIIALMQPSNDMAERTQYMKYAISDLVATRNINDFIYGGFLYYNDKNCFLSNDGKMDMDSYFMKTSVYEGLSTKDWSKYFTNKHFFEIMGTKHVQKYDINNKILETNNFITVTLSLPVGDTPKATMGIQVDTESITGMLNKIGLTRQGNIYIFDNSGNIIAKSEKSPDMKKTDSDITKLLTGSNSGYTVINKGARTMVSFVTSEYTNWRFVAFIPYSEISEKSGIIKTVTLLICIIFILIGFIISYISSRKVYSPIKDLINSVNDKAKSKTELSRGGNELVLIKNEFESVLSRNKELNEYIDERLKDAQEKYIRDLIQGKFTDKEYLLEKATEIGINFRFGYYTVSTVKLDIDNKLLQLTTNEIDKVTTGLCSLINSSLYLEDTVAYSIQTDKYDFAIVINSDNHEKEILKHSFNEFLKLFNYENDPVRVTVSVTSFTDQPCNIPDLYKKACETVNYRILKNESQLIEYDDLEKIHKNINIHYPKNTEENIINLLLSGNYTEAINFVNRIIDANLERQVPYEFLKGIVIGILNTIINAVSQKGISVNHSFSDGGSIYNRLEECVTGEEIKEFLRERIEKEGRNILKLKKGTNEYKLEEIIEFINENFYKDVYLDLIAEQVGMSAKYISRFFKEQTGENFIDYINKIRVKKAKQMLTDSDFNLNEIAEKTGFKNISTFMRAFKRFEGVSPGVYRQMDV